MAVYIVCACVLLFCLLKLYFMPFIKQSIEYYYIIEQKKYDQCLQIKKHWEAAQHFSVLPYYSYKVRNSSKLNGPKPGKPGTRSHAADSLDDILGMNADEGGGWWVEVGCFTHNIQVVMRSSKHHYVW